MISYYKTVASPAEDFDSATFGRITRHPSMKKTCERILAAKGNHDEIARLKRRLPAVTWQAWQPNGTRRSAETCTANGLFIIDVDHVEDPRTLYELIKEENERWENDVIMLAHVTPSGEGLRIVAKRYNAVMSIQECQEVFCGHYAIECDKAVKDLSRLSFLVPHDYILYYDEAIFTYEGEVSEVVQEQQRLGLFQGQGAKGMGQEVTSNTLHQASLSSCSVPPTPCPLLDDTFYGMKYRDIISEVVERTGGTPVVGERNTRLYEIARILRYTVDFDPSLLAQILPSFGLPESEIRQVAQSAVKSTRSERMPDTLYNIIKDSKDLNDLKDTADPSAPKTPAGTIEPLPPVFRQMAAVAPHDFRLPSVMSLLPILGTLASTARAKYLDGTYHSPSFLNVVVAPQASGKSFARRIVKACLAPLEAEDIKARLDEQAYRKALREAKNSKQQPSEPETVVRCVPASISVAKLLKRLDMAQGLHLFTFCEEVDTLAKSNSSGAWAQKTDIYRNAFDNATYGQDYMTDITYSATVEVLYNLLILGTPNAVGRFFKDPEDGLVSRVCFTQLPDQFGADIPVWQQMDKETSDHISNVCRKLLEKHSTPQERHYYDLGEVNTELDKWLREQRDMAVLSADRARDIARRRAAVVGFRAALVAQAINECGAIAQEEQLGKADLCTFARFIADVHINAILSMYGNAMERALAPTYTGISRFREKNIYAELEETFTSADLYTKLRRNNSKTPARTVIYSWRKYGLIEKTENGKYKKTKTQ